jgi:hypothetical protein
MAADLVGLIGMSLILSAFVMNQARKWRDGCMEYETVNAAGSALLVYYALMIASWPFLILNLVWLLVSARGMLIGLKKPGLK